MDLIEEVESKRQEEEHKALSGPNAKDLNSGNSKKLALRTEENLTPPMKIRRDRFIRSYVIDFNGTKAALRIGIPMASAPKQASELLREPYVQQRLNQYIMEADENILINRNSVIAGLVREANLNGAGASHTARVAAYKTLGKILGMEIENVNVKQDINVRGGVMLVPASSNMNEWEQQAIDSQSRLKHEVEE